MTSGISRVDLGGLGTIVSGQDQAVEAGRAQFQRMVSEAGALAAGWQGPAATQFQQALNSLNANGNGLFNVLNGMSQLMAQTRGGFQATNDDTTTQAGQLSGSVGQVAFTGIPGL